MSTREASAGAAPPPADAEGALVRSRIYKALSLAFLYPSRQFFEELRDGGYAGQWSALIEALPRAHPAAGALPRFGAELEAALAGLCFEDYETAYITTFDVGTPQPPCAPYEGNFREGIPRAKRLLNIVAFYRHFGLKMSEEECKRELADHASVELEFMHFLAFKEAQAREAGEEDLLRGYALAQRDFLARHLTAWFPKFTDKLKTAAASPAFASIAAVAAAFIEQDLIFLRGCLQTWGVPELREMPEIVEQPSTEPAATGCCPAAGD
ncbi:MAG: hypothetical protein A2150_02700 [Candidatus Muproteobacteria bacterium RBG_16_64_11]|uniref:Uncharacterized protein n=1 Tax=Candidatus Muproteobacteria bacterium RBG_16_64_11 TaxID=1817758 RepID=A0A1F6TI72_9PROT|nr:MAG: hypothetical protein A2150_02700 [Candidatus Muproteobacteria bacterium RBG_16_64_11]